MNKYHIPIIIYIIYNIYYLHYKLPITLLIQLGSVNKSSIIPQIPLYHFLMFTKKFDYKKNINNNNYKHNIILLYSMDNILCEIHIIVYIDGIFSTLDLVMIDEVNDTSY